MHGFGALMPTHQLVLLVALLYCWSSCTAQMSKVEILCINLHANLHCTAAPPVLLQAVA
jgi:hypothetical protein